MNKRPVTDTWADISAFTDCRSSMDGGPHSTANFRADHPGGVQFVYGDGSVHFENQSIDLELYRRLSTISEGLTTSF